MRIDIVCAVPGLLDSAFNFSIVKKAQEKGLVGIHVHNLRDFAINKHGQIDDYQFGGGAGMVLMIEPIFKCIQHLKTQRSYDEVIFLTPDGQVYNQQKANELSLKKNIILLCGHYKGVDQRVRDQLVTLEISIGDYVLSGGELAAAILTDSLVRLLPGAISDETSALTDSFQDGLLSAPVYTRPFEFEGLKVPDVLVSGNFSEIEKWRNDMAIKKTNLLRPDLLED